MRVTNFLVGVFTNANGNVMKDKSMTDSSFFAKMLLLFALVFLGHPQKRKGLEVFIMTFASPDSISVGQIQSAKIATSQMLPASLSR